MVWCVMSEALCSRCKKPKQPGRKDAYCLDCRRTYNQKYSVENKERSKAYNQKYRAENKERSKAYQQKYRVDNKELISNRQKKHYVEHIEQHKERRRKWQAENRAEIYARKKVIRQTEAGRGMRLARSAVYYAKQSGALVQPMVCEMCGVETEVLDAHHDSYAVEDRLKVNWLCKSCHVALHLE